MLGSGRTARLGPAVAAAALLLGGSLAVAQEDMSGEATPAATTKVTGQVAHPAHIHAGDCANLGPVVFPLSDVGVPASGEEGATPIAEAAGGATGAPNAIPAYLGITQLDAQIDDILTAPHAINVHESAGNIETYIACGEIGGVRYGDNIQFGLRELNGSGYTGIGLISANPDGGVNVLVYLAPTGDTTAGAEAMGTPVP